jgi:hypothetical protein
MALTYNAEQLKVEMTTITEVESTKCNNLVNTFTTLVIADNS